MEHVNTGCSSLLSRLKLNSETTTCKHRLKLYGEVFKERKEGVERETVRHNGASTMAESDGEDKGHDVRKSVTGEASRRIDCMQRISLRLVRVQHINTDCSSMLKLQSVNTD